MRRVIKSLSFVFLLQFALISGVAYGGEEELFSLMVDPDALITLDLSGSMGATPYGDDMYSNATSGESCSGDKAYGRKTGSYNILCNHNNYVCSASSDCSEPYYKANESGGEFSSCPGGKYDCRKANIARKAIFALLDDDGNGKLQEKDQESLGIRVAYMRFKECVYGDWYGETGYSSGCNKKLYDFNDRSTDKYYENFYNTITGDIDAGFGNRTPLVIQLNEAKQYLDAHKSTDPLKDCRKKFVLFITDGWDTMACGHCYWYPPGHPKAGQKCEESVTGSYAYKRRRATIKAAKEVADAGYKVFVIGFGADMPETERYTLEWAAYLAGTDNPLVENSGNTSVISILSDPCATYSSCSPDQVSCANAPMDPGYAPLTGYAYLATDANKLNEALRRAMEYIKEARYSFTVSSVSAARLMSENYLYEASFIPLESDPFWLGHLKKYQIDDSGGVVKPSLWDAGEKLKARGDSTRKMYTLLGGTMQNFATSISPTYFGYNDDQAGRSARDAVVGYFRGNKDYNQDNWKLGDIFHSNPITIASPPIFYNDFRSPAAYTTHLSNNKGRERLLVLGANDGQFHAFSAEDGQEKWSFIPPNFLPKLKLVAHYPEPAPIPNHQFFVDGPVTVTEAWLGSGEGLDKPGVTGKNAGDWRTLLIFGLGKGVRESHSNADPTYLWSRYPTCDSDFKRKYNPPHQYYCGYYAFDVTDTSLSQPVFKWRINLTSPSQGIYLDEPWSKMAIGRVRIDGNEKWVGFIGGGFSGDKNKKNRNYDDDTPEMQGKRGGKGLFVVDLSSGDILWSFTRDDDSNMDYPIPASPAVVDWDGDGFVDTAYIADLGGNMWRFRFCSYEDYKNDQSCNTANWKGGRLFASTTGDDRPVFTRPTVASDEANQLWVFWGTGNKLSPSDTGFVERFLALKDTFVPVKSVTSPPGYTIGNLQDITSTNYSGVLPGWYLPLPGSGEKSLSEPTVFGGMVLFTTYTPAPILTLSCDSAGTGRLYAMAMMPMMINGVIYNPGAGLWAGGEKSISLGTGMPTAPVISQKPRNKPGPTDVFVTVSGGGGADTVIKSLSELTGQQNSPAMTRFANTNPQAQITHWRDRRLQ
jgi:hypothetical protein